jgi:hypothetical protein
MAMEIRRVLGLSAGVGMLLFSTVASAQIDAMARPKAIAAKPAVVGRPLAIPRFLSVKLQPPNQSAIVGAPVTYTVQVTQTGTAAPVNLVAQTSTGRAVTLNPTSLPAAQSGTATLTLTLAPGQDEQPGSYGVQVNAESGGMTASGIATLALADPECGSGPPSLSVSLGPVRWAYRQAGGKPGPATVPLTIKNSGGRLPNQVTVRIFRVGSNCQYGSCINGPLLPSGQVSTLEVPVRGGCARTLFNAPVAAQSTILPNYCLPGATKYAATAQVQVVGGPEVQGGAPAPIDCANLIQ